MRVLLLNPPFFPKYSRSQRSPGVIRSGTLYYPIWLAYATGVLEEAGYECRLVDAPADCMTLEECLSLSKELDPGLIVIDTSTPSIFSDLETAKAAKEQHPESTVVLVGNHASSTAHEILADPGNHFVDFIAQQEYDYTLRDLAAALEKGEDPLKVAGLYYQDKGSGVKLTANREYIENLDELPMVSQVYKRHLDYKKYFYSITQYPVMTIITGRGCPYQCTFCQYPQTMHGHSYRYRSVQSVVDEFEWVEKNFPQVKEIFIEDDTLTVNRLRMREMAQEMMRRGIKLAWTANSRCDVDEETLRWMKKGNCRLLCVGVESGEDAILKNIKKRITTDRIRRFAKDAKRAGVMIHGCFMMGNQGESKETMEKTFQFAKELNFDTAQFFPLMVYPGTEAYDWAKKNDFITTDNFSEWVTEEGTHNCVISRPGLTKQELVDFCNDARRRYYLRPSYMMSKLRQVMVQPTERKRVFKASKTFFKYLAKRV
jgi:anaerobic magnesium-protoporphyrin IX monomethyl ester cyclase